MRQLRTQCTSRAFRPNYPVTLKSRQRVTQGHWRHNHWIHCAQLTIFKLFGVKYCRNLEMWIRGHSRVLKILPCESLGTVSYSPSIVTMAVSFGISEILSVEEWPVLEIWVWGRSMLLKMAQFDRPYDLLLVRHCNYSSVLYRLRVI